MSNRFSTNDRILVKNEFATSRLPSDARGTVVRTDRHKVYIQWDRGTVTKVDRRPLPTGPWSDFRFENESLKDLPQTYSIT